MVKASEYLLSLEDSAWKPSKLSFMNTDLRPRQQECLPACTNPGNRMSPAPMAQPNFAVSGIPDLKTEETNGAHGSLQFQGLLPTPDPYLKTKKSMLSSSGSSAKRFLIFDRCGNQTRLIYNSVCFPSPNPNTAARPICCYYGEEQAARVSQIDPGKYILHESSGENTTLEESEMHEDTEEINALLYSDDDDEYGDDDEDDDETASTGHSPMDIKGRFEKYDVDYLTDEAAGPDSPNKRQKLLDGGYKKSSPMAATSSVKLDRSVEYGSDAESGYAFGQNQGEKTGSILGKMCFRRDKICETLRILERIIPGAEGKDPLFVIDEAIDYLKILKLNAKSLGVNNQ